MIRSWMVIAGVTFAIALGAKVIRPAEVKKQTKFQTHFRLKAYPEARP